jgi:NAD(P)-dependent dehydrogenase (short-subunit alcohol dehydrogenase family)
MDVTDANDVSATLAAPSRPEAGRIDVLVNNAGIIFYKPVEEVAVEDWDRLLAVNLRGAFLCVRAVAPGMKRRRSGAIINVSSNAGIVGGLDEIRPIAPRNSASKACRARWRSEFAPSMSRSTPSPRVIPCILP